MATAGRVLLLFKGDYNSATQYVPMDCVKYQGTTYVCIQTSQNNLPTNTTYFQVLAQGVANAAGLSYDNTSSGLVSNNVQNAIDELDDKIGTLPEYTPTYDGVFYRKYGRIVEVHIETTEKEIGNTPTNISSLPEGYRPNVAVLCYSCNANSSTTTPVVININTDGSITAATYASHSAYLFAHVTYFV